MASITTKDGTQIYYRDWGTGQPVVFSHGWPLSGDAFEDQMFFLASRGYRCIAPDRRGHGRSSQPWSGNDMDHYADDLAELVEMLDLRDAIHVGHSTGGGEVARYIGRHGTKRVAKAVLIGAVAPLMLKTAAAMLSSKLVRGSILKVYSGLPHGMCSTHKDQINADLLAFLKG
jgi:non-heme chloroperoxidase